MRSTALLVVLLALAGCGTSTTFENRAVCTLDRSSAFVVSRYGPLGISSELAKADVAALCLGAK